jgi:hypothetical protein
MSSQSSTQKLHQIILNFYTKTAQCIVATRCTNTVSQGKVNRWFNTDATDSEDLKEDLRPWKQSLLSCFGQTTPSFPTLVVEIYLDVAQFPVTGIDSKPRLDVRQKDRDGYGVVRRSVDLMDGSRAQRLLLETWQLTLTRGSLENVSETLPALYKRCSAFFQLLQSKLTTMPAHLCQANYSKTGLPVGYRLGTVRFMQGQGGDYGRELGLDEPLGAVDVDEFRFSGIETPMGTFNLHTVYRISTDFVLANTEARPWAQLSMPSVTSLPPIWPQRSRIASGGSISSSTSFSRIQRTDSSHDRALERANTLDKQGWDRAAGSLERQSSFDRKVIEQSMYDDAVPIEDEHWQPKEVELDILSSSRNPKASMAIPKTRIHGDVRGTPSPSQSSMYYSASMPISSQAHQINRPRPSVDRDQEDLAHFLTSIERRQRVLRQGEESSPSSILGQSFASMERSALDKFHAMRNSIDGLEREIELAMEQSIRVTRRPSQTSVASSPSSYHSANAIPAFRPSSVPKYGSPRFGSSPLTRPPLSAEEDAPKRYTFSQNVNRDKDDSDVFRMSGHFDEAL